MDLSNVTIYGLVAIFAVLGIITVVAAIAAESITSFLKSRPLSRHERLLLGILGFLLLCLAVYVLFLVEKNKEVRHCPTSLHNPTSPLPSAPPPAPSPTPRNKLVILTGQPGSAYWLIGEKLRTYLSGNLKDNLEVITRPTDGSVENCRLLNNGENHQGGDITIGLFQLAAHNDADCQKSKLEYILPLYNEIIHFAIRKASYLSALRRSHGPVNACSVYKQGLPIYVGAKQSATYMTATKALELCREGDDSPSLSSTMDFENAIAQIQQENGSIKAGFFNQPAWSPLIKSLIDNSGDICLLSFSGELDGLGGKLRLEEFNSRHLPFELSKFYSSNTCDKMPYRAYSSISVIAYKSGIVPVNVIQDILDAFYNKAQKEVLKIAPEVFPCHEAFEIIHNDPRLIEHGGSIDLSGTSMNFYQECR